jgi:hypothetical protein
VTAVLAPPIAPDVLRLAILVAEQRRDACKGLYAACACKRIYCEHYRETVRRDQELRGLELVAVEVLP